jgi:O-antigen ligase
VIGDYAPHHKGRSSHNSVIVAFVELGVPGGLIFLGLVAGSLRYLRCTARMASQTADPLRTQYMAYGLLISLITYFVASLGTQRFDCESYWWVLVLPLSLFRLAHAEATGEFRAISYATKECEPAPARGAILVHGI